MNPYQPVDGGARGSEEIHPMDTTGIFQRGWEVFQKNPAPMLLGAVLTMGLQFTGQCGTNGTRAIGDQLGEDAAIILGIAAVVFGCLGLVLSMVQFWLQIGYIRIQREILEGRAVKMGVLFSGGGAFLSVFLFFLLSALVGAIAGVVGFLPAVVLGGIGYLVSQQDGALVGGVVGALPLIIILPYVSLGMLFGVHAVAIDGLGPVEALKRSWRIADGNRIQLIVVGIVAAILSFVGLLFCFVGLIVTIPVTNLAFTELYLRVTRGHSWDSVTYG